MCAVLLLTVAAPSAGAAAGWYHDRTYGVTPRPLGDNNHVDGMASDPWGGVYVADNYNHRAQKFDSTRSSVLAFGTAMLGQGGLRNPQGVGASPVDGAVYVTDSNNRKIEKYDSSGQSVLSFGSAGTGNGQFGGGVAGIAVRADGEVWVSDTGNHRIQRFSSSGTYLGQFGSNGTATGRFNGPRGGCFASNGDFYVADTGNHRIQRFTSTGTFVAAYGSSGSTDGRFNAPRQVACAPDGSQFAVADTNNHRVQRFDSTFTYVGQMGSNGTGPGQYQGANGVAIDSTGRIWASDFDGSRVHVYEANGTYVGEAGQSNLAPDRYKNVFGIAPNADGSRVYVSDTNNNRIQYYDGNGSWLGSWGTGGTGNGQFNLPYGMAVAGNGDVLVLDRLNNRVQRFTANGAYISQFGSSGTGNGQFSSPWDLAVSPVDGSIYVADTGRHRIQRFSDAGAYLGQVGTSGTGNGQFSSPQGVAVDSTGAVYVADSGNQRIQKFTASLAYTAQWGTSGTSAGQFRGPSGIAAMPDDSIVVVENDNPRIQHFTNAGAYLRMAGTSGIGTGQLGWPRNAKAGADGSLYIADASNSRAVRWRLATAGPPNTLFVHDTDAQATSCGGLYCVNPTTIDAAQPHYSWINQYGATISGQRTQVRTDTLSGVVGLWHLDADGSDASGNSHAMGTTGAASYVDGGYGFQRAARLPPSSSLYSANHARYNLSTFTIEAWVRHAGPVTGWPDLIYRGIGGTNRNYGIYIDQATQRPAFSYSSGGVGHGLQATAATPTVLDGLWHHVAATSDGATARLYVDGVLRASASMAGTPDNPAAGPGSYPDGSTVEVDELRISNVARSAEEIAGYYRTRLPHATLLWDSSPTDAPVALASCADGARCADILHGTGGSQPLGELRGGRYTVQGKFHSGTAWSDWSGGDWYEHATGRPSLGYVDNTSAGTGAGNNAAILALDPRFSWTNNMGRGVAADRRRIQVVTTPLDDVEALWRFDASPGATVDSSGNGNSLTAAGTPTSTTGQPGFAEARTFNGVDRGYRAASTVGRSTSMTFEAWVRFTSCAAGYPHWTQGIVSKADASSAGPLQLRIDCDGGVHAKATAGGNTEYRYSYEDPWRTINDGQWHYVAGVLDGTNKHVTVYVDGRRGERVPITGTIDTVPTQQLAIGTNPHGDWFNGDIDEVRISTVARTEEEIRGYYNTRRRHYDTIWDTDPSATGTVTMASCGDLARCTDSTYAGATMRYADARYYARARHKESAKSYWSAWSDWDWYQARTPPAPTAFHTSDVNAQAGAVNPTAIASPTPRFSFTSNAYQSSAAQRTQVVTTSLDGVLGLWHLDGSGTDTSEQYRGVTLGASAAAPAWGVGRWGQGLVFDGVDDTASAPSDPDYDRSEFTVEAWFNTNDAGSAAYPVIVGRDAGGQNRQFSIFLDPTLGNIGASVGNGTTNFDVTAPSTGLLDGQWHHVALTVDGTRTMRLYVDGVAVGTPTTYTGTLSLPAQPIRIGSYVGGAYGQFKGAIDEVRFSSAVRSPAEILGAYRTGRPHDTVMWDSSPSDAGVAMATCASGSRCADVVYGTGGVALPLIRDGARYHVRAKVLTQSGSWSAWSLADWFETDMTLTVAVDQPSRSLGSAVAGSDVTATTVVTVTTNNPTGYQLLATDQSDANWASRDASTHLPDWTGTDATPTAWAAGAPGYGGITVLAATGGATSRLAKWGTGTDRAATDFANNLYAGLRQTTSTLLHDRGTQHLAADTVTTAYRANAAASQPPGTYTATVTYTAVAKP